MRSLDTDKAVSTKTGLLGRVVRKNRRIKASVQSAASELESVNDILKEGNVPERTMQQAIAQNEGAEQTVAKAADDLELVNIELTEEMADRTAMESELADMKTDLAEARDDLSKAQVQTEEAQQVALRDPLTGLPNRILFEQCLDGGLGQAKRHGWSLAVLFIDIDQFKSINDSHGHDLGDQVLLMVAERLKSFVRDEDIVSRWGGDEFVCLCLEVNQEADAFRLAQKMLARIAEPCEVAGITLTVRASIGVAIYPADGETADVLFKNADAAMYAAKGTRARVVRSSQRRERRVSAACT